MRFPNLATKYYSDTLFTKLKSIKMNAVAQVFIDGMGDNHSYPLRQKSQAGDSLMSSIHDVGVPRDLVTDDEKKENIGDL